MHKKEFVRENKAHKIRWARRADFILINKKKRTCHYVDYTVPAEQTVKIKESKKIDECLGLFQLQHKRRKLQFSMDLARELEKKNY